MATASAASQDRNNLDLVRFVLASMVFLVHAYALSDRPELRVLETWLSSEFAVEAFFTVSGYLIFMSYEKSSSLGRFFDKRARRIYPAYVFVIVAAVLGGAFLTRLPLGEYLSADLVRYLAANLVFMNFAHPTLPGVFESNKIPMVNGALWTLKIEAMFYLTVPVLAWLLRRWPRLWTMAGLYAASVTYTLVLNHFTRTTGSLLFHHLQVQLPGQLAFFMAGAMIFYYDAAFRKIAPFAAAAGIVVLKLPSPVLDALLGPIATAAIIGYFGICFKYLGNFGRFGDFSYGIYIWHFPVLQTLIALGVFNASAVGGLLAATGLVLLAALLSWHLIEKPFLKRSSHYVVANTGAD
jgi:peptidoglycan/LPS O-acetylase OafA/YrhL